MKDAKTEPKEETFAATAEAGLGEGAASSATVPISLGKDPSRPEDGTKKLEAKEQLGVQVKVEAQKEKKQKVEEAKEIKEEKVEAKEFEQESPQSEEQRAHMISILHEMTVHEILMSMRGGSPHWRVMAVDFLQERHGCKLI